MLTDFFRRPLGLALAGGGSLGSWQTGALCELTDRLGLGFDAVLGFSAGALNAGGYFLDRLDECVARWKTAEEDRLLRLSPNISSLTLFSGEPVWRAVTAAHDDERARRDGRCRLVVVSRRHDDRRPVYSIFDPKDGRWDGRLAQHLVASCAIPRIYPPVRTEYRGQPLTLIDGGVYGREPLSFGELAHCKDILVLEMVRPEETGRWWSPNRTWLRRSMDHGVASLRASGARVFRVCPSRTLDFSMLSFRRRDMEACLQHGAQDARAFLKSLS